MWRQSTSIKPPPWRDGKMFFQQFNTTLCFSLVFFCSCEQDSLEVRWQIIFQSSYRHVSVGLTLFLPVWTPDKLKVCGALMSALECNWVHFLLMPHCTPPLRCASEGNVVVFTSTAFISQLYSQVTSKIKIYNNFIDDQLTRPGSSLSSEFSFNTFIILPFL